MLSHQGRAWALEDYYNCDTSLYSLGFFYDMDDLKAEIAEEINAGRPLMLHMRDTSDNYHAVAIDDYRIVGSTFEVHINMGWEGSRDGYYNIAGTIYTYDDTSYRKIMTVRPPEAWPIPGDANYDSQVNATDAAIVASAWGSRGVNQDYGDFTGDGVVNAADAAIITANWGYTAGEASHGAVPEPGVAALVAAGLLAMSLRRASSPPRRDG